MEAYTKNLALVKKLYVEQGRSLSELAITYDIAMFVLKQAVKQEGWEALRDEFQSKRDVVDPTNSLTLHSPLTSMIMLKAEEYLSQMDSPDVTEADLRRLRLKIAALKDVTEAVSNAIEKDRQVKGVRSNSPSVPSAKDDEQGVRYKVAIAPLELQAEAR